MGQTTCGTTEERVPCFPFFRGHSWNRMLSFQMVVVVVMGGGGHRGSYPDFYRVYVLLLRIFLFCRNYPSGLPPHLLFLVSFLHMNVKRGWILYLNGYQKWVTFISVKRDLPSYIWSPFFFPLAGLDNVRHAGIYHHYQFWETLKL